MPAELRDFDFDRHTACEIVSTRGAEACIALSPHVRDGLIYWFDQTGRGRITEPVEVVRATRDDLRVVDEDGVLYRFRPLTVARYRSRILPLLGPYWSPWAPSGDTEIDRAQLEEHLRSLAQPW